MNSVIDYNRLTPMMKQYMDIKNKYPDDILFYRLGDFYEMFFDDAIKASEVLDVVLTSRHAGDGLKAELCGVPYHSAQYYLKQLLDAGLTVAICEQLEDPKQAKNLVKRDVIKRITPGTITDFEYLEEEKHHFLSSARVGETSSAYCVMDLSTFDISCSVEQGHDHEKKVISELESIGVAELLLAKDSKTDLRKTLLKEDYFDEKEAIKLATMFLKTPIQPKDYTKELLESLGALLRYVQETQQFSVNQQFYFNYITSHDRLYLDHQAMVNLELFETIRTKQKKGSLLWAMDRTVNVMGKRALREMIRYPLRDKVAIEDRLNSVEDFLQRPILRGKLRETLKQVKDLERIMAKLVFGNLLPRDMEALFKSLEPMKALNALLDETLYEKRLSEFSSLRLKYQDFFLEDLPLTLKDGGCINPEVDDELREIVDLVDHGTERLLELEKREQEETGIKKLRIKYNRVFGYFIEVTNSFKDMVPDHYIRKQTLAGSERYFTEELKALEEKMSHAKERRIEREKELYEEALLDIKKVREDILETAKDVAHLDCLLSLAELAFEENYVRPSLIESRKLSIQEGRHPVIEQMIKRENFVVNDTFMDEKSQFFIITGPNMAGKSTYLRQVALISLMAHIGSFVPAERATIPLLDGIYTRVGASDDLSQGKSTFMVEMTELASILQKATNNSLVILDEIGRGTSTYDGLSIAWSVVEYLTSGELHPLTLFATHYHELTEIEDVIDKVSNYRIDVKTIRGELVLLRKIVPGRAKQSFGIEAARLAGLPDNLLNRAKKILLELEGKDIVRDKTAAYEGDSSLKEEVLAIDINSLTPLEALQVLDELIKGIKE